VQDVARRPWRTASNGQHVDSTNSYPSVKGSMPSVERTTEARPRDNGKWCRRFA